MSAVGVGAAVGDATVAAHGAVALVGLLLALVAACDEMNMAAPWAPATATAPATMPTVAPRWEELWLSVLSSVKNE